MKADIADFLPDNPQESVCIIEKYQRTHKILLIGVYSRRSTFLLHFTRTVYIETPTDWRDASFKREDYDTKVKFMLSHPVFKDLDRLVIDEVYELYTIEAVGVKIVAADVMRIETEAS